MLIASILAVAIHSSVSLQAPGFKKPIQVPDSVLEQSLNQYFFLQQGLKYYKGDGVSQDYWQARLWFLKAAALGNAEAKYHLGTIYRKGFHVLNDYAQAYDWYSQSAKAGYAPAQYYLGFMNDDSVSKFDLGKGFLPNKRAAVYWYEAAARQGYAPAQLKMARLSLNPTEAKVWAQKVLKQEPQNLEALGILYLSL